MTDQSVSQQERRGNPITRLSLFLRQVVAELRKVVWPTRQQLVTYFWVVLVFVVVVMTLVSLLDLGFGKLMFALFA
ncbi:preprotein translocase subunit SecE [Nocardioides sp. HDW12B]|nr:preprotein translocase subunit SecE [Nocardioides sp. HDW12B]